MKKTLLALAMAATVAGGMMTAPGTADARDRGGAVAAGVVGGLIGGAILGGAIAGRPAYAGYAPAPGYVVYPAYAGAYPVDCPDGYWARRPVFDRYGNQVGYSRPRFFCP